MNYQDIRLAREKAECDIREADMAVRMAVDLIVGRLKSAGVWGHDLEELKRELRNYNMHTGLWKD